MNVSLKKNGKLKDKKGNTIPVEKAWEWDIQLEKSVTWDSVMKCIEENVDAFDILAQSVTKDYKASDVIKEWKEFQETSPKINDVIDAITIRWIASIDESNKGSTLEIRAYTNGEYKEDGKFPINVSFYSPASLSGIPVLMYDTVKFIEGMRYAKPERTYTMPMKVRDFFLSILEEITFYGLGIERESEKISMENLKREVKIQMNRVDQMIENDDPGVDFFFED